MLSMLLVACGPTATPEPTEPPVVPTEVPTEVTTEVPTPSVDPTGQTVTFWHVWGTGLPNETMLAMWMLSMPAMNGASRLKPLTRASTATWKIP